MRRLSALAFLGLMLATTLRAASGCVDWANDCRLNGECCPDGTMNCFGAKDAGPDGDSGSDGGDGGEAGPPPSCIPSMNSEPVAATCGVFVSSEKGDDTNGKGTPTSPYKTIGHALAKNAATIYACAGTTPYSEALSVDQKVTLFGALDCGTWKYDAANKTQLTALADMVPLTLSSSSASGTEVEDFAITAADATVAGGSSIAVLDDNADLDAGARGCRGRRWQGWRRRGGADRGDDAHHSRWATGRGRSDVQHSWFHRRRARWQEQVRHDRHQRGRRR